MRAQEFTKKKSQLKTFVIKVKLPQQGYQNIMDTMVQARTAEMARRIVRAQYNNRSVIVGQPREVKPR